MADGPAASACSMPQTTDGNDENTSNHQVPELGSELIEAGITGQSRLESQTVDPASSCEAKAKIKGIESPTSGESTPDAQASQHLSHDPRSYGVLRPIPDDSQEHPGGCAHVTNPYEERDLERGEPCMPPPNLSSEAAHPIQDQSQPDNQEIISTGVTDYILSLLEPYANDFGRSLFWTEHDQSLIDSLRSIAGQSGEEIYRRYALGYGTHRRHGWFVNEAFDKITTASSSKDMWWLTGYLAVFIQHLVSRWVHGGHRKYFQTMFCMDTAVYLLQNIGDPSDRWINDTLGKSLGLDPQFFDEHLALVYDGSLVSPRALGDAPRQLCPRAWHVWAVSSDEQVMRFSSLETFAASDKAVPVCVSFQRTDTDSCKSKTIQPEAAIANQRQS